MNTDKNMSKIPTTEEILLENFKGLVYPYVGSSMLVNHQDEGVIIKNANICLDLAKQFSSQQNKELIAENQTYISLLDDATKEFNRQEKHIEELKAENERMIDKITTLDIIDFLNNYTKDFGFNLSRKEFVDFSKNLARKLNGYDINPITPNNNEK